MHDKNGIKMNERELMPRISLDPQNLPSVSDKARNDYILRPGDCLEILPKLQAQSVDMIFADPPYNLSNDGFTCHAGRAVSVNKGEGIKVVFSKKALLFEINS